MKQELEKQVAVYTEQARLHYDQYQRMLGAAEALRAEIAKLPKEEEA